MCRTASVPSGIRLQHLIRDHHLEILDREKGNERFIHLYDTGAYRVAFERSAYRLCRLFRQCEITLFCVPACPDYVVMASVSSGEVQSFFQKNRVSCDGIYQKVLCDKSLQVEDYRQWHEVAVRSVW